MLGIEIVLQKVKKLSKMLVLCTWVKYGTEIFKAFSVAWFEAYEFKHWPGTDIIILSLISCTLMKLYSSNYS